MATPRPGLLHRYTSTLTAFEHTPHPHPQDPSPQNTVLFLPGLGDTPLSVTYTSFLAARLPKSYSLAEVSLSSAASAWGISSLARDAAELAECISYFSSLGHKRGGKIVLLGHSTGCQDAMEYLVGGGEGRPRVHGVVLQAGVSDREGWDAMVSGDAELAASLAQTREEASRLVKRGDGDVIMPKKGSRLLEEWDAPCTAYRVESLLVKGGDDDYFSTDLEDEVLRRSFGRIPRETKVMFLWGSKDPYIPGHVDKEGALKRWAGFVKEGGAGVDEVNGGVVAGATHNLNDDPEDVVQDLVDRIVRFVEGL